MVLGRRFVGATQYGAHCRVPAAVDAEPGEAHGGVGTGVVRVRPAGRLPWPARGRARAPVSCRHGRHGTQKPCGRLPLGAGLSQTVAGRRDRGGRPCQNQSAAALSLGISLPSTGARAPGPLLTSIHPSGAGPTRPVGRIRRHGPAGPRVFRGEGPSGLPCSVWSPCHSRDWRKPGPGTISVFLHASAPQSMPARCR